MSRYIMQWDAQPMHLGKVLCSLLEAQSLVDLTIICHTYSIKVHKCVLAANSIYFRERLQKDMSIDRVIINGIKQVVFKCLIEFMYCGETSVAEDHLHEFISAAKYFKIFGITAVIPEKFGLEEPDEDDEVLIKPPVFFSKNEKTKSMKETLIGDFSEKNVKMLLNENEYPYNTSRSARPLKVTDEAHVALAKEEAASRFALEMLKKDISNTSNVFVIDETCTEATVETNLTAQYENPTNMIQIQEFVLENNIPEVKNMDMKINEIGNLLDIKTKQIPTNEFEKNNKIYDNQIIYKSTDGSYVNVNNQMLNQLNNHNISYEVMPPSNPLELQQFICNDFEYNVDNNDTSFEVPKQPSQRKLTYNELVAETVNDDYESDSVDQYSENVAPLKDAIRSEIENILTNPDNSNISNDISITEDSNQSTTIKKKRGRPAKRKLEKTIPETKEIQCFFNDNQTEMHEHNKAQILSKDQHEESVKENVVPKEQMLHLDNTETKKLENELEDRKVSPVRNRRQTRSSTKINL